MKRYKIKNNGKYAEDPNGDWVIAADCSELIKKCAQYETILKRIEALEWYRIDEAPKLAKWVLDQY
jgi:hypothetical protein